MKNNPFTYALAASMYIVLVAFVMNTLQSFAPLKQTIVVPMFVLSLFVLSAAVMGFLFFYQPFRLYFDGQKNQALLFFAKTLGAFACCVALFFVLVVSTMLR